MSKDVITKTIGFGDGKEITIETGKMARQADGSVIVKMGKTMLLATVVSAQGVREGLDYFPLSVDYQEKYAAAGRIPGGFFKREGRLGNSEILVSRLVDRALRPLFPDDYKSETQVLISLISSDPEIAGDSLAAFGASAALTLSDIPFNGPISEVRVIKNDGKYIVNPLNSEIETATLDIILAATEDNILMVEGEMAECSEDELIDAIKAGHEVIKIQCKAQLELAEMAGGIKPKREYDTEEENVELRKKVNTVKEQIYKVASGALTKSDRSEKFKEIRVQLVEEVLAETDELEEKMINAYYKDLEKMVIRDMMLDEQKRLDGRKLDEVRPISCEVNYLPSAHGSALFTRGETQSLTSLTLGGKMDEQIVDTATVQGYHRFLLQYNFPPFSVGEARMMRGPSRREVGHGNLALRSLKRVLPPDEENPYTIRLVSDILESNGSSSMATVCAGSLALMDGGIPISGGVSGIAMGLISGDDGKVAILSDILGDEDHLGDMDFKVTGTKNGICACQMDIKIDGLSYELLGKALEQAKTGRTHILDKMNEVISTPNPELKEHAPRIEKIIIDKEFIGAVIGPGGKVIQEMQAETETTIHIDEVDGKGEILILSTNGEGIKKALAKIDLITTVPEEGKEYEATVKNIMPFGAFMEFLPGKDGLLHISEISHKRIESMDGVFNEGDVFRVKLIGVDPKTGKCKLSRKALLEKPTESSTKE